MGVPEPSRAEVTCERARQLIVVRAAINLLTEDPRHPSGAHWFWARVIPEMAKLLGRDEEIQLMVSPACRPLHEGYGPAVKYIWFPWSNERRVLRVLSEHFYAPLRLPLGKVDVLNTAIVPVVKTCPVVIHIKTMHAFTIKTFPKLAGAYRRATVPRSARLADAIIVNSKSLQSEVQRFIDVPSEKFRLVPEAVDHRLFYPGDREQSRQYLTRYGVTKPFALFVSSLWRYKNCAGLLRAWAAYRTELRSRQLVIVGGGKHADHIAHLHSLAVELGISQDVVWAGPLPQEELPPFYRAADVFVYPSFNETFGLPILEAMATGCPVVTSNLSCMPETAGGAAELCDPKDPLSIGRAILSAVGEKSSWLRERGLARAKQFSWASTASLTLDVYREVGELARARARARRGVGHDDRHE
jgi:glycosyltransferase involved in cell wall biosynthesis